jgi:hypothetical protein
MTGWCSGDLWSARKLDGKLPAKRDLWRLLDVKGDHFHGRLTLVDNGRLDLDAPVSGDLSEL